MRKKKYTFLIMLFCIIGVFLIICTTRFVEKQTFTQKKWMNNPYDRHFIVKDMLKKKNFESMNKEEVISLLGSPEPTSKWPGMAIRTYDSKKNVNLSEPNCSLYFTTETKNKMPEEIKGFYIKYDDNNRAIDFAIIHFTT